MKILGIDAGKKGSLALIAEDGKLIELLDMPLLGKEIDKLKLLDIVQRFGVDGDCFAYLEQQHIMAKQAGQHKIGIQFGYIEMALVASKIGYEIISPMKWKKFFKLSSGATKGDSVRVAQQYFPDGDFFGTRGGMKDGRAEACLIGLYGLRSRLN